MSSSKTTAPPQRPANRDRQATEQRIVDALAVVLSRDGFGGLGVNAVARQAGVDKVLIYRYFGGLPELLAAYGKSGGFWPSAQELMGSGKDSLQLLPSAQRYAALFARFIDALRARPLTLEILAHETIERNELTAILEAEREAWGTELATLAGRDLALKPEQLLGLTNLLIAGVQYLLIRSRKIRHFGALDLQSDAGWDVLKASIGYAAHRLIDEGPAQSQTGA